MNWQPIETAPRDGTSVLCWLPSVMFGKNHPLIIVAPKD